MTVPEGLRNRILTLLSTSLDRPIDMLDNGQSFQEMGVDSVAVVDALFTLEENLGITLDFNAAGAEASDLDGPVSRLVDLIAATIPDSAG